MRRSLLFAILSLSLVSCATSHQAGTSNGFNRYQACHERMVGGRMLHDTGWVVAEHDAGGGHFFSFLSNYWGRVVEVTRVNRFCNALRSRFEVGVDRQTVPSIGFPSTPPR